MRNLFASSFLSLGFAVFLTSSPTFANGIDELSQSDQNRVKNGEQVAVFKDMEDSPWPECTVYQRMEVMPEQAAALFSDYEIQQQYIPNLAKSKITKLYDKKTAEIDYTLKLPFGLGEENYTVRDVLSTYNDNKSYKVEWSLVKADSTKYSRGSARFETLGTSTLFIYKSFIIPGRWGSSIGWVVDGAKQTVLDTVTAIIKRAEYERINQPALLQRQVEKLQKALSN